MQVTVTLTFASAALAAAFLATADADKEAPPTPAKPTKTDKPAGTPPSASPTPAAAAAPAPAPTPATPAPSPAADPAADYLKSGIPEIIQQAIGKVGKPPVVAELAKLDVKKGSELKPEQFARAKAAFEALLAPAASDDLT